MIPIIEHDSAELEARLSRKAEQGADVSETVRAILKDVRENGDKALAAYTQRFDNVSFDSTPMRFSKEEIASCQCDPEVEKALLIAAERIADYHNRQMPENHYYRDEAGVELGWRWQALPNVGIYVPGGTAAYPSSVLMNAIPAMVAGVGRIAMVVPTPSGIVNPAILVAARIAGIDEIYRIGGAQAVAALTYGTASIKPVVKIVGPGNAYVAEAKRQVFGMVGIDMVAGPSEILVVSDRHSNPRWIAADLLSQAEHDIRAQSVLITDDLAFAEKVQQEIENILATLPRRAIAEESISHYGAIVMVKSLEPSDVAPLINRIAPEHLELALDDPDTLMPHIYHAGAIFIGRYTPEAFGDYIAGPSHVLPTSATARFSSGLSVFDFLTRSSLIRSSESAIRSIGEPAAKLADAEGLDAHALSLRIRWEGSE